MFEVITHYCLGAYTEIIWYRNTTNLYLRTCSVQAVNVQKKLVIARVDLFFCLYRQCLSDPFIEFIMANEFSTHLPYQKTYAVYKYREQNKLMLLPPKRCSKDHFLKKVLLYDDFGASQFLYMNIFFSFSKKTRFGIKTALKR